MTTNAMNPGENQTTELTLVKSALAGIAGGVVGGIVFGVMMAAQGMMPMIAALIGQQSEVVGFIVHMLISIFIGATFGAILSFVPKNWVTAVVGGGAYGIVWWVLGALLLMPTMLGMNEMVFVIGEMQINSLIGHIIFGVVMGVVYKVASARV